MKKGKPYFLRYLSFIVAVFALGGMIMATVKYISLMPTEAYEDCDVLEFVAAEWYTKTEEIRRQGGASAHTRYHYYVRYTAVDSDGASYSYYEREASYEKAKATADAKTRIKRRVFCGFFLLCHLSYRFYYFYYKKKIGVSNHHGAAVTAVFQSC